VVGGGIADGEDDVLPAFVHVGHGKARGLCRYPELGEDDAGLLVIGPEEGLTLPAFTGKQKRFGGEKHRTGWAAGRLELHSFSAGCSRIAGGVPPLGFIQTGRPVFMSTAVMRPNGGLNSGNPWGPSTTTPAET